MELAASDVRFDVPLNNACAEERKTLCADAQPGHGRIVRCLQTKCALLPTGARRFDVSVVQLSCLCVALRAACIRFVWVNAQEHNAWKELKRALMLELAGLQYLPQARTLP